LARVTRRGDSGDEKKTAKAAFLKMSDISGAVLPFVCNL
jgi:hypothetical protein